MASRDPRAGEVDTRFPGTLLLTCPVCGTTHTILRPDPPGGPWYVDCTCGIPWRIRPGKQGQWVWINRRFDAPPESKA